MEGRSLKLDKWFNTEEKKQFLERFRKSELNGPCKDSNLNINDLICYDFEKVMYLILHRKEIFQYAKNHEHPQIRTYARKIEEQHKDEKHR